MYNRRNLIQVFRGPQSHEKTETQMFYAPIEAKYVRLLPLTWRNSIAVRVALLGCPITTTTLSNADYSTVKPTIQRKTI